MTATYVNPAKMFNSELFPAPEGPIMTDSSPDLNSPDTPWRISLYSEKETKLQNLIMLFILSVSFLCLDKTVQ